VAAPRSPWVREARTHPAENLPPLRQRLSTLHGQRRCLLPVPLLALRLAYPHRLRSEPHQADRAGRGSPHRRPRPQPTTQHPTRTPPLTSSPAPVESDARKAVTYTIHVALKKSAETAVLRTTGYPGGYTSMNALIEGAITHELARLADEFNNGDPFPPNPGNLRRGRPLGS
jgi:hypothetical protein